MTEVEKYAAALGISVDEVLLLKRYPHDDALVIEVIQALQHEVMRLRREAGIPPPVGLA